MPIPSGYAEVLQSYSGSIFGATGGSDPANVYHLALTGLVSGDITEELATAFTMAFADTVHNGLAIDYVRIRTGTEEYEWSGSMLFGKLGTPSLPNIAVILRKLTGTAGRSGKGRMYVPGVIEEDINQDGQLDVGVAVEWQDASDAWLAALATIPTVSGLGLVNSEGTVGRPVTSITVDSLVGTQRRRLR